MAAPIADAIRPPAGTFAEFGLLPELLSRTPRTEDWARLLRERGAKLDHVEDADLAKPEDPWPEMAEDALRFCRFAGLVGDGGISGTGRSALAADDPAEAIQGALRGRLEGWHVGRERVSVVRALLKAAGEAAKTPHPLPGLLLGEMALVMEAAHAGASSAVRDIRGLSARREASAPVQAGARDGPQSRIGAHMAAVDAVNRSSLDAASRLAGSRKSISITEARATATLLVHAGLFVEVFPSGPTHCLAAPVGRADAPRAPIDPAPVVTLDGGIWDNGMQAGWAAAMMAHLLDHSASANDALVFPSLRIDMESRRAADAGSGESAGRVSEWRRINKALAMEMLSAALLARLDGAEAVFAQWSMRAGRPHRFAGSGLADIEAAYPPSCGFDLVAAVSAKREVTAAFARGQLKQALRHGRRLHADRGRPVYALAVNGGRFGSDPRLWSAYREFAASEGLRPDGPVRVVPVCGLDLAASVRLLELDLPPDGFRFPPETLAAVFDKHLEVLEGPQPADADWMRKAWLETVLGRSPRPGGSSPKHALGPG